MKKRTAAQLVWSVTALSMAAILAGVVLQLISPSSKLPSNLETGPANIVDNLTLVLLPVIGALVADRLDALGGRIDITSTAGEGTPITGRLPEHLEWEGS